MLAVDTSAQRAPASAAQRPGVVVSVGDEDDEVTVRQQVLESLVDEFLQVVENSVDRQTAQQYLNSNQMDLRAALDAYYNDPAL